MFLEPTKLPLPPNRGGWDKAKAAAATAVSAALLSGKLKGLLLLLLNLKWFALAGKFGLSALSFFASIWFYALFWGWKFAAVFVLLILIHEMGHMLFIRWYGVPASLPYFIPGLGAFVAFKGRPASILHESYIALGGPLLGTLGALCCYGYGQVRFDPFWIAAAYSGFSLNFFNLFPVLPLDGGRVVGSITPRIWIVGFIALITAMLAFHWWNPLLLILIILGIPRAIDAWRNSDEAYTVLTKAQRIGIATAYFGLCGVLLVLILLSRVPT